MHGMQAQQTDSETSNIADAEVVRQRYNGGCSVRLLHPQQWVPSVAELLAPMEQLLQCPLGCNVYLTPADSQVIQHLFFVADVSLVLLSTTALSTVETDLSYTTVAALSTGPREALKRNLR